MSETLTIKREGRPVRCEVCHQTDLFNPETGECRRCSVTVVQTDDGPVAVDGVIGQLAVHRWNVPDKFRDLFLQAVGDEPVLWVGRPNLPSEEKQPRSKPSMGIWALALVFVMVVVFLLLPDMNLFLKLGLTILAVLMITASFLTFGMEDHFESDVLYVLTPTRCLKIDPQSVPIERIPLSPEHLRCVVFNSNRDFGHLVLFEEARVRMGYESRELRRGFFYIENIHLVERLVREHLLKGVERVGNADH